MSKTEYETWRKQEIAAIKAQSGKMQVIQALDALWQDHPAATTVADLLARASVPADGERIRLAG